MPLKHFALYFLSVSTCAVILFPRLAPPAAGRPVPPFAAAPSASDIEALSSFAPETPMHLTTLKKSTSHRRRPAPDALADAD